MKPALPTIWMNVTTSANWRRPPVGIVRVEQSLKTELAKIYGDRLRLCVWVNGDFAEWHPQSSSTTSYAVSAKPESTTKQLPPIFPLLPKRQALINLGQSLLSLMPDKIRPFFNRALYYLRPKIAHLLTHPRLRSTSKIKKTKNQPAALTEDSPNKNIGQTFSPGDVLISIGLDWDHPFYKEFYYLRKNKHIKIISCCYDLIPVIYPQYCIGEVSALFTSYFLDVADGSDVVLCISEQSREDFLALMDKTGGAKPATHIIPLGDNVPPSSDKDISLEVQKICNEPFILFVSTIERRKNHEVLYRAYHFLCSEGKRNNLPKLVFVGMQGWGVDELFSDVKLDPLTRDLIVTINHVTDSELRALYDAAKFCVYPSLYEGWGLPVGEALSLGKAVLSSDRGSLPEVGGEAVQYIDPWNPRDWADKIYRMVTDDAWLAGWEQKAKEQYHARTWSMSANSVQKAIENICKTTD